MKHLHFFGESVISISLINLVSQQDAIGGKIQMCVRVHVSMLLWCLSLCV